jgi:hypothetical protein
MDPKTTQDADPIEATYEPPRIETVLTADDLAREIQYAGISAPDDAVGG